MYVFFWLHCMASGILIPQPGIEPVSPAVEVQSVNHWTTREVSRVLNSRLICVIEPVICCRAAIRKDFSLSAGAAGRDIST